MKKLYISFLVLTFGFLLNATAQNDNCYEQYRKVFEVRGAERVEDGIHENVILTVRKGDDAECFVARAVVSRGIIVEVDLYFEDQTFEKVEYDFKDNSDWSIYNGMSKTKITKKDEYINIMFVEKVKPKKKKLMKAPKPNFDLD